jgi:hypothetical protein
VLVAGAEIPTFGAVDAKFDASANVAASGTACKPASNPVLVAAAVPVAPAHQQHQHQLYHDQYHP